ncbi:zinc-binding alcohol dehydrogenase family protein [Tardiphaga sp. P9-11]|jgi:NADPH:quinone reductase-like Zn-dependent oxidoreductase|uniref:quinone oxidoreductase family protein n=1 Tax=Tardiphaga sp. P9-11 TaxID=2024614 RepID=UPI0011F13DE6|nr:zinc-binding alcohol dehydrogenase family protein [Tardiphaga sp. P9-11]KAA0074997.1 zinc-binding alcohol dehydrogenase family protein [Tardiphaga sp. P9-11]
MTAAAKTSSSVTATCLRVAAKADRIENVALGIEQRTLACVRPGDALVEIKAAAINPSDAKATLGLMPHAVFPRTPGRDFAGVVIDGPAELIGKEVFGSSGQLGIGRDGTHATHLVVEASALVEKPANISLAEAAGIGVPFVTAQEGFRRSGMSKPGETVLILGLNGKVGQAVTQIASWQGARVIGVVRKDEPYAGHAHGEVTVIDSSRNDVAATVRELTGGKGADIVYNTVGEPYYDAGTKSLAHLGRQIFIASTKATVPFDIFAFYRGKHTFFGVDSLSLSSPEAGEILRELVPGFASGALKPFPIKPDAIYPLQRAAEAYVAVLGSSRDRLVFQPNG